MTSEPVPSILPTKPFGPKPALAIFGANAAAQIIVGIIGGMAIRIYEGHAPIRQYRDFESHVASVPPDNPALFPIAILGVLLGFYVAFRMARRNFPGPLRQGALAPLGWRPCTRRQAIIAVTAGILIAVFNLTFVIPIFPPNPHNHLGPMAQAASASGLNAFLFSVVALFVAPPTEEFIFRGVLYTGLLRRWDQPATMLTVSLLFVALHLSEVIGYWPALIGISMLAGGTVVARQRTGTLAAPMFLHIAYNAIVVLFAHGLSWK